jgi:muramoyltetrapeptide carboxypeptidase LdcA involved in peptidoglycan recycling
MPLTKRRTLVEGNTVAAVSLSWGGPNLFPHRYQAGKEQFSREFGVSVVETSHALRDPAWLARNPEARADDLMAAFADPSIRGIISTIGGDESIRILRYIDARVIQANPKIFMGYSDTTVTHLACYRAGLTTFYGPSFMAGFAENGGIFPYCAAAVRRALFSSQPMGVLAPSSDGWTVEHLDWANPANQQRRRRMQPPAGWRFLAGRGRITGHLIGGCLEVLSWLRGTSVWPDLDIFDRAILFLETSEEGAPPSAVTRELRTLAAMGILERLSGLLVGRPGGASVSPAQFPEYDAAILAVTRGEEGLDGLAVVTQMDFGHTDPMLVLPYGIQAVIDCDAQQVALIESGVTD